MLLIVSTQYDELLEPASLQFPVGDVQQPVDDLPPLYGTPVTTGGDYSPGYGGSPPTNAFQGDALDAVTQQMGNDLLSANYLDALEDVGIIISQYLYCITISCRGKWNNRSLICLF